MFACVFHQVLNCRQRRESRIDASRMQDSRMLIMTEVLMIIREVESCCRQAH